MATLVHIVNNSLFCHIHETISIDECRDEKLLDDLQALELQKTSFKRETLKPGLLTDFCTGLVLKEGI